MRLKKMKYPDLSGNKKFNFILPIGSIEQHGPFAPLGTDSYITDYLIDQVEQKFPELIILPTLEFSRSREHRKFFGTIYLNEETLAQVLFDICNSICKKADHIFLTSFHANDEVIEKFIKHKSATFEPAKLIHIGMCNKEDEQKIAKMLGGPVDEHAGNTEISNMLVIDETTVTMPSDNDKKTKIENPFATDDISEKSPNGIADNHPEWVVNKDIGQKSLDIYTERMIQNLKGYL
ncbi:creatininase family protein [Patescibacteria group bacterium]